MSQGLVVCIGDGDDIGNVIDFYLLSGDLDSASKFSFKVKACIEKIASDVQAEMAANLVYVAGDDICFVVSSNSDLSEKLQIYSNIFFESTGKTISFGVAKTSAEAAMCLRRAKVSGKGRIVISGVET
jgi:hypothetical protein